jgi:tight adherence protein B
VRLTARITAAGAALAAFAALALPTLALGQGASGGTPTLREEGDSEFPDKVYTVQLPQKTTLQGRKVVVTENGLPVTGLSVTAPGGTASGAILLIDASNSMKGAPIAGAMAAARAFMGQRTADLPVAVIAYNPEVTVLTDFTTNAGQLSAAVAKAPPLAEGTHVYDALIEAARMAKEEGLERTTAVLLSDGNRRGVQASLPDTLEALNDTNVRVIAVGLQSPLYDESTLTTLAQRTGGGYVGKHTPAQLDSIFAEISSRISREYVLTYRSLLPPQVKAAVAATITGFSPATATYTTPAIDVAPRGTFEKSWIDQVITSPWLMLFVVVAVLALVAFALLTAVDVRNRSLRRRMAQYVTVPTEEESRLRRAEVAAVLADTAQKTVGGQRWWQRFETDVELSGFRLSPLAIAGWTIVGGIAASLVVAIFTQNLWGLLVGLAAPLVTRWIVSRQVRRKREAFAEQLPDNLDVLAGAMRTGHSTMGALSVMVDSADEPSKSEYRRVVQDEQLGVPLDDALMVMARRMQSYDAEQIALVMRLQREAGGNTAEVLDRVAEVIRGRMELRRLVNVLTAQARISRWILTGLPIFVLFALSFTGGDYLDPMTSTLVGKVALVVGAIMILIGSFWIKRIAKLDV